ncbi:MAG: alpha/beta hydrolase [Tissierellia bacterium]|nr:alpha/beta hydrolase [Tissierellia bacterium]
MRSEKILAPDGFALAADIFDVAEPKIILQLIHGASEYKDRYWDFMGWLQERGVASVITDTRGHGASLGGEYVQGFMNGTEELIRDQLAVTEYIRSLYPNAELALFGHSFGSLLARIYMQKQDQLLSKVVLCGTVNYDPRVGFGLAVGRFFTKLSGPHGRSRVVALLNKVGGSDLEWLSANRENIRRYEADPKCGFKYENQGTMTIFEADKQLHDFEDFLCQNPALPILSISGSDDPITGGSKGLQDSFQSLAKVGYQKIKSLVYPGMRHEVLNEVERERVYEDVFEFLLASSTEN